MVKKSPDGSPSGGRWREKPVAELGGELAPPQRLAIAYAPPAARGPWTALLALDQRLERAALAPREAIVAQIKLAWWRERFAEPAASWPAGEPLLAALQPWDDERGALGGLVDGWEGLAGGAPSAAEIAALASARGDGFAALARVLGLPGCAAAAGRLGAEWAVDDIACRLALGERCHGRPQAPRLPRQLRPLVVLAGTTGGAEPALARVARMVRLGLLGR